MSAVQGHCAYSCQVRLFLFRPVHFGLTSPSSLSDQAENKQVKFLKVDVDELQDLAMKYGVTKMPTFLIIKGGQVVDKLEGASKPILENMLLKHR